jgi:hypothetical protein
MRFLTVILISIFMFGCASHNVQMYGEIDQNNKTVTVPPGAKGLKGELKKVLSLNGWGLVVYRGPSVTEGELGKKTKIQQYDTFNSIYRLIVASSQYDICFNFSPAIRYDISFINNQSGAEIFTIDGKGCESDVVKKFSNALNGIEQ